MSVTDAGRKEVDKLLSQMENDIKKIFQQSYQEVWQKANDYMKQFRTKDMQKRKDMQAGKITKKEYTDWRKNQLIMGKRWYEMATTLAKDFTHANEIALSVVNGHMPEVYAMGHNYGAYEVEILNGLSAQISYTLYDRHTVELLIKNKNFKLIPDYPKVKKLDIPKTMRWNKQQLNSAVLQGILQGDSMDMIADRFQAVAQMNRNTAIRNARTMTTSAENAGRMSSYKQANDKGIKMKKQWNAALDGRTRAWHLDLDGAVEDTDKPFVNAYGEIMYPGDPGADPANVYNCRCCIQSIFDGYDYEKLDRAALNEYNRKYGTNVTYEEWKRIKGG